MTEKAKDKKFRAFCFTLNNYTDLEYTAILETECRYLCVGKEIAPTTGTPHLQGYVYFENPRSFKSVIKKFPRSHIVPAGGTPQQNQVYCKKDGDYFEKGECPEQGARSDIQNVREMISEGQGMRQIVETATSYQSIKCAELLLKYKEQKRQWKTETIWVHGKSGSGKTRWAYDRYSFEDIHKQQAHQSKWFDGYDAHPIVILDEVDSSTSYDMLKELSDRHPCTVEIKGGRRSFLAKVLVITSLYHPEYLFMLRPENGMEMIRRIDKIIELPE